MVDQSPRSRIVAAALLVAAIGVVAVALWPGDEPAPLPPAEAAAPAERIQESPEASGGLASSLTSEERLVAAEEAVARARARRIDALYELTAAEAEIDDREREIEELERFIADLEARGEDPARHAEAGLELFRPAYEGYERTAARIEQAEAALRAADADLSEAEAALAAQRAGSAREGADPAN